MTPRSLCRWVRQGSCIQPPGHCGDPTTRQGGSAAPRPLPLGTVASRHLTTYPGPVFQDNPSVPREKKKRNRERYLQPGALHRSFSGRENRSQKGTDALEGEPGQAGGSAASPARLCGSYPRRPPIIPAPPCTGSRLSSESTFPSVGRRHGHAKHWKHTAPQECEYTLHEGPLPGTTGL